MLSMTDWLIKQEIARYFSQLSAVTKINLLTRFPSVSMNEDKGADVDVLASKVDTNRTKQKIRRDPAKKLKEPKKEHKEHKKAKEHKDLSILLFFHIYCLCSRK